MAFRESERIDAAFTQYGSVSVPNQSGYGKPQKESAVMIFEDSTGTTMAECLCAVKLKADECRRIPAEPWTRSAGTLVPFGLNMVSK